MCEGTNLTVIFHVDQDTKMFGSIERSLAYQCIIFLYIQAIKAHMQVPCSYA